ncbi:GNAT family N-acetyltransferase [uncultured Microbulbifer sp.]|uniref:GNAT family N-acetyltransferase n=1 Tax=uncultured Microbulbifer sp. TaxID=348147 RepID=UPI00260E8F03|nr:GNAT family N-acetyltransferase [uncultured Microbulbifer sp.]
MLLENRHNFPFKIQEIPNEDQEAFISIFTHPMVRRFCTNIGNSESLAAKKFKSRALNLTQAEKEDPIGHSNKEKIYGIYTDSQQLIGFFSIRKSRPEFLGKLHGDHPPQIISSLENWLELSIFMGPNSLGRGLGIKAAGLALLQMVSQVPGAEGVLFTIKANNKPSLKMAYRLFDIVDSLEQYQMPSSRAYKSNLNKSELEALGNEDLGLVTIIMPKSEFSRVENHLRKYLKLPKTPFEKSSGDP